MEAAKFNQIRDELMHKRIETYTPAQKKKLKDAYIDHSQEYILRDRPRACDDCGRQVINRQIMYQIKWGYKDIPYWQKKCQNCKLITKMPSKI